MAAKAKTVIEGMGLTWLSIYKRDMALSSSPWFWILIHWIKMPAFNSHGSGPPK